MALMKSVKLIDKTGTNVLQLHLTLDGVNSQKWSWWCVHVESRESISCLQLASSKLLRAAACEATL